MRDADVFAILAAMKFVALVTIRRSSRSVWKMVPLAQGCGIQHGGKPRHKDVGLLYTDFSMLIFRRRNDDPRE